MRLFIPQIRVWWFFWVDLEIADQSLHKLYEIPQGVMTLSKARLILEEYRLRQFRHFWQIARNKKARQKTKYHYF